ncbi:MAG TPA: hypothetical protein VMV69_01715 [Pirellulales bacterium]|nr:hypothetical protein [Pirellulales bacterium]
MERITRRDALRTGVTCVVAAGALGAEGKPATPAPRSYENRLTPLVDPPSVLADYPEFIEPIRELARFEAPRLVDDPQADLAVRSWRFSYNARGIIEAPNRLRAAATAVVMVHPWGIDDGQGWNTPEPAGVCDFCTPEKNHLAARHTREVIDPLLKSLRGKVALVLHSLPGNDGRRAADAGGARFNRGNCHIRKIPSPSGLPPADLI